MRAAVLPEIPSMLEIAEIQVDRPGPREVLVRTVAAGLCHSDLHFMEGKYSHDTPTASVLKNPRGVLSCRTRVAYAVAATPQFISGSMGYPPGHMGVGESSQNRTV